MTPQALELHTHEMSHHTAQRRPLRTVHRCLRMDMAALTARPATGHDAMSSSSPTQSRRAMGGSSSAFCASEPSRPMVSIVRLLCTIRKVLMLPSTRASSITAIACSQNSGFSLGLLVALEQLPARMRLRCQAGYMRCCRRSGDRPHVPAVSPCQLLYSCKQPYPRPATRHSRRLSSRTTAQFATLTQCSTTDLRIAAQRHTYICT